MGDYEITTLECYGGKVTFAPWDEQWSPRAVPGPSDTVVIPKRNLAFAIPYGALLGGLAWAAFWYVYASLIQ